VCTCRIKSRAPVVAAVEEAEEEEEEEEEEGEAEERRSACPGQPGCGVSMVAT
jgi:CO dehydrogenase/acetyl-CoA synthase beta subunit